MPLYDYQCDKCQTVFEARLTFTEKDAGVVPQCPECQGRKTHQLLTTGLFVVHSQDSSTQATSGCAGCNSGSCAGCGH